MTHDNKKLIAEAMDDSNFWNVHDELKGLTLEQLQEVQSKESFPFAVCVLNLTGDLNTGMIARTACIHGAEEFIIFGRRKYDKRSTVGAQNYMKVTRIEGFKQWSKFNLCADKFNKAMDDLGYYPVAVEQDGARLDLLNAGEWTEILAHQAPYKKPCLVFGNENQGIPEDILNECIYTLSLPQRGVLRSMNVSAAAAIAIYQVSNEMWKIKDIFYKDSP